jgi:hypothetical protein
VATAVAVTDLSLQAHQSQEQQELPTVAAVVVVAVTQQVMQAVQVLSFCGIQILGQSQSAQDLQDQLPTMVHLRSQQLRKAQEM